MRRAATRRLRYFLEIARHQQRGYHSFVIPVSPVLVVINLIGDAVTGMAIGALSGWLVSLVTRRGPQGILKDAFLGSFGYLAGLIGCEFMPWPRNTISYYLPGGTLFTSTANTYQHPERVAVVLAILLALLYELYRLKKTPAFRPNLISPKT